MLIEAIHMTTGGDRFIMAHVSQAAMFNLHHGV